MCGAWRSRSFAAMHPTLMTMIADDRALELRRSADRRRRGRAGRAGSRRRFAFRRPRRAARIAHA
jgi:hypothetical protein